MKKQAVALPLRDGTVVFHKDPAGDGVVRDKLSNSRGGGARVGRQIRETVERKNGKTRG